MFRISVVVPCYNESKRLPLARLQGYLQSSDTVRLLFVDDGSTDDTPVVLQTLCAQYPSASSLLRLPTNSGKGEAVRQGMLNAIHTWNPEFVGFWDADLATPLEVIVQFALVLTRKPEIDMVFGSRVKLLGRHIHRDPRRHYLGRVFATFVSMALRLPIYDTQCGAKLFRVDSGLPEILREPFSSKWIFDVEIIARYQRLFSSQHRRIDNSIYEFALDRWEDVAGSKVRASDFIASAFDLFTIWLKYLR